MGSAVLAGRPPKTMRSGVVMTDVPQMQAAAKEGAFIEFVGAHPVGSRVDAVARADLVVVPALAVDRYGFRLGRGGGSYDRALARVSASTLTVALLHDGELLDRLPAEPHDRPVRAVVTPGGGVQQTGA